MRAKAYILAVLLILALAVVFLAPSVNLEPTALRAARAAAMVFLGIFVAGHSLAASVLSIKSQPAAFCQRETASPIAHSEVSLIDLLCSRLC